MERPPKIYFCNKCWYVGISDTHPGCQYLAYPMANPEQLYIDHLEAELAALRASPASVPEGWKIVPVEPTGEMVDAGIRSLGTADKFRAMLAAAPTPPENKALLEAVAEVVWYDPQLSPFPEKPGKIIDGSIAFMESAEIGTKLFAAPTQPSTEDRKDAERLRFLQEDHAKKETRQKVRELFNRLPVMSLSAARSAIDAAMQEDKP